MSLTSPHITGCCLFGTVEKSVDEGGKEEAEPFMDFHDDEAAMKELEEELEKAEKLMGSVKTTATEQQKTASGMLKNCWKCRLWCCYLLLIKRISR